MSMQWDMGTAPANSLFTGWDEKMTWVKIKAKAPCLMNESFFLGTFKVSAVVVHLPSPVLKLSDLALLKIVPVSTGKAIFPSLMVVVSLFSHEVVSDSLWPHGLQHARLPCPALSPGVCPFMFRFMSVELMIPSISSSVFPFSSCPQIFPSIRVFSNESVLHIRWPKGWSFSFSISASNEYSGLISFGIDWFDLLAVKGLWRVFSQHHSLKVSFLRRLAFFMVQLTHLYMTIGKTAALTARILLLFQVNCCGWQCSWAVS